MFTRSIPGTWSSQTQPCIPCHNFLRVEMSEACANTGTICASVIWSGSKVMLRLHVWVDWITLPLGGVILRGMGASYLLSTTGEPLTKKWAVAPE